MHFLVQETVGSFLPRGRAGKGHCWSSLTNLCLTEIMILSFNLLLSGLISVCLVYSPNPKLKGPLATDFSSSILHYYVFNEEIEVQLVKFAVKIMWPRHEPGSLEFSKMDLDWEVGWRVLDGFNIQRG